MECPAWLWNLIDNHAKKIDTMTDYSQQTRKTIYYYADETFDRPKKDPFIVNDYARAIEIVNAKKYKAIEKEIDEMKLWISIDKMPKQIETLKKEINELKNENEELKNLPPVEVERIDADIYPASDPRSKFHEEWKKSKIKKK